MRQQHIEKLRLGREVLSFFKNNDKILLTIPPRSRQQLHEFFLHVVISDKQCTVVPELPDEFAVSATDSPHAQGAYSSKYIFKAIILPPKLMF